MPMRTELDQVKEYYQRSKERYDQAIAPKRAEYDQAMCLVDAVVGGCWVLSLEAEST